MSARSVRLLFEAALFLVALGLGAAAFDLVDHTVADALYFGAWCAAMLLIFSLALRLPLHLRGRLARLANPGIVGAALGLALLANIALYRHDAHFDATVSGRFTPPPELETIARSLKDDVVLLYRHDAHFDATVSGRFTPPPELETIARSLQDDVVLTYFYNSKDDYAYGAKQVLEVVARRHPHLTVRVLDLDTELVAARDYRVKLYNTVVVEAEGRRTQIENTVDLRQMAYAIERVLQRRVQTVCFVTGHGELYAAGHVHFGHVETLGAGLPGASDVLEAPPNALDRLKLAIETIGDNDRPIAPAMLPAIPEDCTVAADLGATSAYAPAEVQVLRDYLVRGGHVLLAYDPRFPVTPELSSLLDEVGLAVEDGVVVDPLNHYGTELATSKDSYVRPLDPAAHATDAPTAAPGPRLLAAAVQGTWPGTGRAPFRLVLIGNASFASNAFFPYASNGDLAVSMIRWLADDTATPLLKPEAYSLPEIRLTHRQMQVTFLLVEVLLPLSVMLFGLVVWWRRR